MCVYSSTLEQSKERPGCLKLQKTMLDYIGVGTGGRRGEGRAPQYFTLETLLILIHAAQIAASQCTLRSPPKMSYAYGLYK